MGVRISGREVFNNTVVNNADINNPDIDGGTIDGATIATSNITVGAGKTLDVSAGTLTLANDQISGDKIEGGTIGSITITNATISGGTINNATIGSSTASTGKFTIVSLGYTTITSSATAGDYSTYFIDASSGNVTLTLPSALSYTGRIYNIVRVQTYPSAYNAVVACQSGQYINGESSLALENNYDRVQVQSNGSNWIIIGR